MELLQRIIIIMIMLGFITLVANIFIYALPFILVFVAYVYLRNALFKRHINQTINDTTDGNPFENVENDFERGNSNNEVIDVEYTERRVNDDE